MLTRSPIWPTSSNQFITRGAGKDFYGHTTANHRRAVVHGRPCYTRHVPSGVYRQWRELQLGVKRLVCLVGATLVLWVPSVLNSTRYIASSTTQPVPAETGNRFASRYVPVGVVVSNLSYYARAAGTGIKILRHRGDRVELRLPSKKQIWLDDNNIATIGQNPNPEAKHIHLTRAGDSFVRGWRPHVRGVAMNPVDHPNGGGQGKTSGGGPSVSPWGQLAKGYKTTQRGKNA